MWRTLPGAAFRLHLVGVEIEAFKWLSQWMAPMHDLVLKVEGQEGVVGAGQAFTTQAFGPLGLDCGIILWESKRTKHWNADWLPKLRTDQRSSKAAIAVMVSQAIRRIGTSLSTER